MARATLLYSADLSAACRLPVVFGNGEEIQIHHGHIPQSRAASRCRAIVGAASAHADDAA